MWESLTGFVVVGVAIVVGWIIGRIDLLGEHARPVLARLTFFVLSPFLLFVVLAQADVRTLFSALLPVSLIAAVAVIALHAVVARVIWRRSVGETVIGALSAGQVNSNNIGLPLSLYLLGSAAFPAPVILMQLLLFTPVTLAILDAATSARSSERSRIRWCSDPHSARPSPSAACRFPRSSSSPRSSSPTPACRCSSSPTGSRCTGSACSARLGAAAT